MKELGLPSKFSTLCRRVESIRNDRSHGSRWLAKEAVKILKVYGKIAEMKDQYRAIKEFENICRTLADARPNMAAIGNSVYYVLLRVLERARKEPGSKIRSIIQDEADKLIRKMDADLRQMVLLTRKLVRSRRVFVHSYSSSVAEALRGSRLKTAIVTESRPLCEGRILANELSKSQIPVTLITDASAGIFIPKVDLVLVGADSVLSDGSIVNKTGTYPIALISHVHRIPFYVLCETSKFEPSVNARIFNPEEGPPWEVAKYRKNISVRNVYFDVTPSALVTKVITEKGVMSGPMVRREMARLREISLVGD